MMPESRTRPSRRIVALLPGLAILIAAAADSRGDEPRGRGGEAAFRGKIVLFGAQRKDVADTSCILALNPDGTGLEALYTCSEKGRSIVTGRVSPDARSIAFTIFDEKTRKGEVWVQEGSKGPPRKILDDGLVMAWAPDGKRLACIRGQYGAWKSFVLDLSTKDVRPLAVASEDHVYDWSPDGESLCVMLDRPGKTFEHPRLGTYPLRQIGLIPAVGGEPKLLTPDATFDNLWARFSPDGARVTHYQRRHRDGVVLESAVITGRDGVKVLEVLDYSRLDEGFRTRPEARPFWSQEGPACWSPDGKTVALLVSNHKSLGEKDPSRRKTELRHVLVLAASKGGIASTTDLKALGIEYPGEIDWGK